MNFCKKYLSFLIVLLLIFSLFTLPLSVNGATINKVQSGETTGDEDYGDEWDDGYDDIWGEEEPSYEYIVLDDGTAEISAYYGYEAEVTIPSTIDGYQVTSIGESAFAGAMMESLIIPEGITNIANSAFESCCDLLTLAIPDTVLSIGDSAFFSCSLLSDLALGDNLISIGAEAFSYCESLTNVEIPANVQIIGDNAFAYCSSLEGFTVDENNWYFYAENGILFNSSLTCLITYPQAKMDLTSYTIPDSVFIIGINAFTNSALEEIILPEGVEVIGNNAFDSCYNIMSITLPDTLISLGEYAFTNCICLEQVYFGSNLRSIGIGAFTFCESLGTVDIPASVTHIGDTAFLDTESLSLINVASDNTAYSSQNGVLFNKDKTELISCPQSLDLEDCIYNVPNTVVEICDYGFYSNNYLWEIYLPDSVKTIGNNAFDMCYEVMIISLGNGVESIGNFAFSECYNISEINLPETLTSIGSSAFYWCNVIENIVIPDGVTEILDNTFDSCEYLTTLTLGKNVTTIGRSAFSNCISLETLTIPDSVTEIDSTAFANCQMLREITFGKGLKTISDSAFSNCSALKTITFPESLSNIGDQAFEQCTMLTSATIPFQVESIGWDAFYNCNDLTIYGYYNSTAQIYAEENNIPFVGQDKNGFFEEDGDTYYYENSKKVYAGLIKVGDDYYYVNSSCMVLKNIRYFISKTNGLLPAAYYDFDSDGKMINVPEIEETTEPSQPSGTKNGIVLENGQLYYYKDNVLTYAGLIKIDGYFYYVNSSCKVVTNANYYISKTNNLLPYGGYLFGNDGKMLNPPKVEETMDESLKNGIVNENGELYYYFNGVRKHAGLVMVDGNFYYANSDGKIITDMHYYISKTNGYCERGSYYFDAYGRLTNAAITLPEPKNGIVTENGLKYYYVNDVRTYAGLIKIGEDYYYVNSSCIVVTNTSYYVSKNNGILPSGKYEFDEDGKILELPYIEDTNPDDDNTVKNGIIRENNILYYYVDNVKTYAGLIVIDGNYYYANSSGRIVTGTSYYISKTNDKIQAGIYTFDANGVMDIESFR